MATRVLDRAYVYINGTAYKFKNDTITISGIGNAVDGVAVERTSVRANTGFVGYSEAAIDAMFTGTLIVTNDQGNVLTELSNLSDGTIIVKTPDGKITYTLSSAFSTGNITATVGTSEAPVTFHGDSWVEDITA